MTYTIDQAISLAQSLEPKLFLFGYHCALGGSCLHKGGSDKDIDIFIYPHSAETTRTKEELYKILNEFGFKARNYDEEHHRYLPEVYVTREEKTSYHVDFFILERPSFKD